MKRRLAILVVTLAFAGCNQQGNKAKGGNKAPPPGPTPVAKGGTAKRTGGPGPGPGGTNKLTKEAKAALARGERPEPGANERPKGSFGAAWETNPDMPKSQYMGRQKLEPGKDKGMDTAATCKKSFDCKLNGHCSVHQGWCVVTDDDDCKGSVVCKEEGRCRAVGKKPWKVGCEATSDADCRKANDCQAYGRCSFGGEGRCTADSEDDCKKSEYCEREGKCTPKGGECINPDAPPKPRPELKESAPPPPPPKDEAAEPNDAPAEPKDAPAEPKAEPTKGAAAQPKAEPKAEPAKVPAKKAAQ